MRQLLHRFADQFMVAMSASAVVLAIGIVQAQASAGRGWRLDATIAVPGRVTVLLGVTATSRADAWSVGVTERPSGAAARLAVERWNGTAWRAASVPASLSLPFARVSPIATVGASSGSNAWVLGEVSGRWLRWNSHRWTVGSLPRPRGHAPAVLIIASIKVFSRTDAWAFGSVLADPAAAQPTTTPYAAHFDGTSWKVAAVPGGRGMFAAVSAISRSDIWAVLGSPGLVGSGMSSRNAVVRWNGHRWRSLPLPSALSRHGHLASIVTRSDNDVWIGGGTPNGKKGLTETAAHWNGGAWSIVALPARASSSQFRLTSMVADGHGGIWGLGATANVTSWRFWHLSATTTTGPVRPRLGGRRTTVTCLASVPGAASVWAVGAIRHGSGVDGMIALAGHVPH